MINIETQQHLPKCVVYLFLNPKGWYIGTPRDPSSTPYKIQSRSRTIYVYMGVSKNNGTPKSSILIGFFHYKTIHFGGNTAIFGNAHIDLYINTY